MQGTNNKEVFDLFKSRMEEIESLKLICNTIKVVQTKLRTKIIAAHSKEQEKIDSIFSKKKHLLEDITAGRTSIELSDI